MGVFVGGAGMQWLVSSASSSLKWSDPSTRHFRNRPVDIPHSPRIVQLGSMPLQDEEIRQHRRTGGVDVTVATRRKEEEDHPLPPSRELLERYNPMPHDAPKLRAASTLDKGKCQQMYEWQTGHNPTCNSIHESSWSLERPLGWYHEKLLQEEFDYDQVVQDGKLFEDRHEQVRLVAGGAFRWVFMIREYDGTRRAMKTLRIDGRAKNFDLRNFDRHRRDAVAMDQLTASPLVVDMYGYCSNTAIYDWGEGGDLSNIFKRQPDIDKEQLLRIAYNVSLSIHDAHHLDGQGRATMAHTDIKPDQFLYQNGYYRLTDFNRVRFLMWNHKQNRKCGFKVQKNGGLWRSPEEYAYDPETEKVDVYSLGNVLFFMLLREEPWKGHTSKMIYKQVQSGQRPKIPEEVESSTEVFDRYMIQAMKKAWINDPYDRPSAFEIAQILHQGLQEYEAGAKQI